jgi:hypothetical protein
MVYSGWSPISAQIVIHSGSGAHLMHSSTEHLNMRANDFIISEHQERSEKRNCFVDLMQTNVKDKSLIDWKEKFGGQTVKMHLYYCVNSRIKYALWNSMKRIYPLFR